MTLLRRPDPALVARSSNGWVDPIKRLGYNAAIEARPITRADLNAVVSRQGGLVGVKGNLKGEFDRDVLGTTVVAKAKL